MDPKHATEMFKHLEKQGELLMDAYRSMSHDLHRLGVEEEMLMRKFYELMSAQGLMKKNGIRASASTGTEKENGEEGSNEEAGNGNC